MFKINLHAHTDYSDGKHSLEAMVKGCKNLGYSACVITDHVLCTNIKGGTLTLKSFEQQVLEARAISAKLDYPVIIGIELGLYHEEVLIFGTTAIAKIMKLRDIKLRETGSGRPTLDELMEIKSQSDFAMILCHPMLNFELAPTGWYEKLAPMLDGYEQYNNSENRFCFREVPDFLKGKKQTSGADAHYVENLSCGWNTVDENITTEEHLIKYLQSPVTQLLPWTDHRKSL